MTIALDWLDSGIILFYFMGMLALGFYLSRKTRSAEDYFLAGRGMIWPVIGLSLFASNISSTTLVGLSGDAYRIGISVYAYEWMGAIILVLFAVFLLPILLRKRVYTMPEYLAGRYNTRVASYFSVLTIFLSIVVETAGSLYAGALVLKLILPDTPLWQTMTILALIAGIYTLAGGLAAVMLTDAVQAILLLVGSCVIAFVAFDRVGGLGAVLDQVPPDMLSLIRPIEDPNLPWLGLISGVPLLGFYYWATNQAIVQRALAARSIEHGRWGVLFAGFLKLTPLFIMILPGSAAILLYPNLEHSDLVYPTLMFDLLPSGLLGLTLAGFIAAIMSQIDSSLNSASTLVTMDFVRRGYPNLGSRKLMAIGRLVMAAFLVFAILWAPFITNFPSIFSYIQTMFSYAVPPVVALFLLGIFWRRTNSAGAMSGVVTGVLVGAVAFLYFEILDLADLHFLYMAPLIFVITAIVIALVSLLTPAADMERIEGYLWTRASFEAESATLQSLPLWQNYRIQAIALFGVTALIIFSFY